MIRQSILRSVVVAAAVVFAGNSVQAEMPVLGAIPANHTLFARAETLAGLKEAAKATLTFESLGGTEFVWTAKDAAGVRHFTHATAYVLKSEGRVEYVLLNPAQTFDTYRARRTVAVATGTAASATPGEGSYAAVLSMNPKYGTLYQLSFDRGAAGKVDEERILMMHDPEHGWRFVDALRANYSSKDISSHINTHVTTAVTWTGNPEEPVSITFHVASTLALPNEEISEDRTPITLHETYSRSGSLPLASSTSRDRYLTVSKGDTFNTLTYKLAHWQALLSHQANNAAQINQMKKTVLAMNPKLKADHIGVGEKILLPNLAAPLPAVSKTPTAAPTRELAADYPR